MDEQMTAEELEARARALLQQAEELRKQELRSVIADIKAKMVEYGITPEELEHSPRRRRADRGGSVPPKYRGPNGETWTGRGRAPAWVREIMARGESLDAYRVNHEHVA